MVRRPAVLRAVQALQVAQVLVPVQQPVACLWLQLQQVPLVWRLLCPWPTTTVPLPVHQLQLEPNNCLAVVCFEKALRGLF